MNNRSSAENTQHNTAEGFLPREGVAGCFVIFYYCEVAITPRAKIPKLSAGGFQAQRLVWLTRTCLL